MYVVGVLLAMLLDPIRLVMALTGGLFSQRWSHAIILGIIAGSVMAFLFSHRPGFLIALHFAVTVALTLGIFAIRQQFKR